MGRLHWAVDGVGESDGHTIDFASGNGIAITSAGDEIRFDTDLDNLSSTTTLKFAAQGNGYLELGSALVFGSPGIQFHSDTNLYRQASDSLWTDDNFTAASLRSAGTIYVNHIESYSGAVMRQKGPGSGINIMQWANAANTNVMTLADNGVLVADFIYSNNYIVSSTGYMVLRADDATITFGSADDVSLYRAGANQLRTDDEFNVNGVARITSAGLFGGQYHTNYANTGPYFEAPNTAGTSGFFLPNRTTVSNVPLIIQAMVGQTGDLQRWADDSIATLSRINKAGTFITNVNTVPADADLNASDLAIWFDDTDGAAKVKFKSKTANGTVRTGEVALT